MLFEIICDQMTILAGDVGGTKVHLALFLPDQQMWLEDEKFPSNHYKSLEEIISIFLKKHRTKIECACFGIAGPVQNGECHATNLPWVIKASQLEEVIGSKRIILLNDLEANAYGISSLAPQEMLVINLGQAIQGNAALIAAGTGLGEAGLYWDGQRYRPFASEGGHVSYAPEDELELELWQFLRKQFEHVSYERLLSGTGLALIYRFLTEKKLEEKNLLVERAEEPAKAITQMGLEKKCPTCLRALDWFVQIYGSEAGNLALKMMALGGIYIGGGIAPKIAPLFCTGKFMKRMVAKGRFSSLLSRIPVRLILNENTALLGAANYVR